jgi:hypothetical protein
MFLHRCVVGDAGAISGCPRHIYHGSLHGGGFLGEHFTDAADLGAHSL